MLINLSASREGDRYVGRGSEAMGGERNVVGGGFLEVSHRSSALPARRANVFVEGSQSVQHGGGESRLRDGYRQASRGCRIERGSFSLPSSHLSFCTVLFGNYSFFLFFFQLRKAIEDANAGILPMHCESHIGVSTSSIAKSETDTESKNVSTMNSIASVDCEKVEKV